MGNDHTASYGLVKVILAWVGWGIAQVAALSLSQIVLILTGVFTVLQIVKVSLELRDRYRKGKK